MLKETVYNSHSEITSLSKLIKSIFRGFAEGKGLAKQLFIRDVKGLYRQSIVGFLWMFITPIATSVIWIFLRSQKVVSFDSPDLPYPVFVFTGIMLWQVFIDSIQSPLKTVMASKSILIKLNFPKEALLLTSFYDILLNVVIKLIVLFGFYLIMGTTPNSLILFAPLAILGLVIFGYGIGVLLVPIGLLYSDIQKSFQLGLRFLMFMSPVLYPVSSENMFATINKINPITPLLVNARNWLTGGEVYELGMLLKVNTISVLILLIALVFYRIAMPNLVERMGS